MKVASSILRDDSQIGLGGLAGAPPPASVDSASFSAAALGLVGTSFPGPLHQPVASVDNDSLSAAAQGLVTTRFPRPLRKPLALRAGA